MLNWRKERKMLKQVQHDTIRGLLRAERLLGGRTRSLQDDKERELRAGERLLSKKHAVSTAKGGL
jgi:hypothetical protein